MPLLEGSDVYPNISTHWSEGFKELKYFRSKKVMKKILECIFLLFRTGPGFCYKKRRFTISMFYSFSFLNLGHLYIKKFIA